MGIIKSICITGADYVRHGIRDDTVLSRLLVEKYGFRAAHMIEDLLLWSRRLAEMSPPQRPRKQNCWEARDCPKMITTSDRRTSLCPAIIFEALDGVHGGFGAGRMCWAVEGTYCDGGIQGSPASKASTCNRCGFYKSVADDEGRGFITSLELHDILEAARPDLVE